jgi:hypothetical protein
LSQHQGLTWQSKVKACQRSEEPIHAVFAPILYL